MIFVKGDNLIYSFLWGIPTSLRLFNLLRVATFVDDEVKNVEHFDGTVEECGLCGLCRNSGSRSLLVGQLPKKILFDSGFRGGAGRGGSRNLATKRSTACWFGRREILVPRLAYFRTPIGGGLDYDGSFVCSFHIVFISSLSM